MTRQVRVGDVLIGGGAPISIQSMTNTSTGDVKATVEQIARLTDAGCEIVRCAVPDREAAEALSRIKKAINIPLVADIHFDYRLALSAIENGADKVRINPGNIGSKDRVQAVLKAAREREIPIRIGVNSGSLERRLLGKYGGVTAEALAESAVTMTRLIEDMAQLRCPSPCCGAVGYPFTYRYYRIGNRNNRQTEISCWNRSPALGRYRRHHARISDRRSCGGGPLCERTVKDGRPSKRWHRSHILPDLWKD